LLRGPVQAICHSEGFHQASSGIHWRQHQVMAESHPAMQMCLVDSAMRCLQRKVRCEVFSRDELSGLMCVTWTCGL